MPLSLIPITDLTHPEVQIFQSMRARIHSADGSFVADSPKVVNLLLALPIGVRTILATQAYYDEHAPLIEAHENVRCFVAPKAVLEQIVGHKLHHNVMMQGVIPESLPLDKLGTQILMVDALASEENIGALSRSAAALGVRGLIVPHKGPQPYGRRALRVSMGHTGLLAIHYYEDIVTTIAALKCLGYTVFAAEVGPHTLPLAHVAVPEKWVLLMGNEDQGLSQAIQDACDATVQIEMIEGIKSFNVAIAASIMMYRFMHPTF